jgi:dTMP kinase
MHSKKSKEIEMQQGLYVIFEGGDGTGKTTAMAEVAKRMSNRLDISQTHHPGSTPLGAHIRKLVKFPKEIDQTIEIDDLSRQLLYMVDTVSFINSILIPSLESGQTVFADRSSFISALVYGTADGLSLQEVQRLFQLIEPPKADRLYIMQCPWETGKERVSAARTGTSDHYDQKEDGFFQKIQTIYDNLLTTDAEQTIVVSRSVALENVIYIDASQTPEKVVQDIVDDFTKLLDARFIA